MEPKHGIYAAVPFSANLTSWFSRNDMHFFTSVILYMNIIFIAQWLFGGNSEILHCSDFFACPKNFINHKTFSSKPFSTFLPRIYDAKGPFCVTRPLPNLCFQCWSISRYGQLGLWLPVTLRFKIFSAAAAWILTNLYRKQILLPMHLSIFACRQGHFASVKKIHHWSWTMTFDIHVH